MLPKKIITKKQTRIIRRQKFLYYFFCLIIFIAILFLGFLYFKPQKNIFLNPLSPIGFSKNYIVSDSLRKHNIDYKKIDFKNGNYTITLKDGGIVIIPGNSDINGKISSLQLILSRLKIEGKGFKSLDFRYNNPVIF